MDTNERHSKTAQPRRRRLGTALGASLVALALATGAPAPAEAATSDGATSYCQGSSQLDVWASRGNGTWNIIVNLPTTIAVGRTFVRYHVAPTNGVAFTAFTSGWYYADRAGLGGMQGPAYTAGTKFWIRPDGTQTFALSDVIATSSYGTDHTIWQQRYVLVNGQWYGNGAWEQVARVLC